MIKAWRCKDLIVNLDEIVIVCASSRGLTRIGFRNSPALWEIQMTTADHMALVDAFAKHCNLC